PERLMVSDSKDGLMIPHSSLTTLLPITSGMRPLASERPNAEKKKQHEAIAPPGDIVIDVIVAYTRKAAGSYSDIRRDLVDLAVEQANESFRMSKLGHVKLRLVHAYQTDYEEEGAAHFDHVWRFADKGAGY